MKLIIAGTRNLDIGIHDIEMLIHRERWVVSEVISGHSGLVDLAGERWAARRHIPVKLFPVSSADWERLGKKAGPLRNEEMSYYADALLAIWDGHSRGTKNMIDLMGERIKPYIVVTKEVVS